MKLEVNGVEYTNFTSAVVELRLDALSNTFDFELAAPEGQPLPFKGGEACTVIIGTEPVLSGHIEVVSVNYGEDDHTINIRGRDKTGDLLDSSLGIINDLRGDGLTLKTIIERVIAHLSLDLLVIDEADPAPFNAAEDVAAPEPGDNAFQFIEKYSKKRNVLLTSNADGNIVIAKNSGITATGAVQHIIGATDNNVLRSSFSFDQTSRFLAYRMKSALNPTPLNKGGDTGIGDMVNQFGVAFDPDVGRQRQMVLVSDASFSSEELTKRAQWEADIRKSRSLVYSATVPGHRVGGDTGALWRTNRLYQIVDDFLGKTEPMLCNSVSLTFGLKQGRQTSLGFVGEKSYTLFSKDSTTSEVASNVL